MFKCDLNSEYNTIKRNEIIAFKSLAIYLMPHRYGCGLYVENESICSAWFGH